MLHVGAILCGGPECGAARSESKFNMIAGGDHTFIYTQAVPNKPDKELFFSLKGLQT